MSPAKSNGLGADFYAELETKVKAICSHRTPSVAPWG
jgi:hypothetical protein